MRFLFLHGIPLDGRMWEQQVTAFPGSHAVPSLYALGTSLPEWATRVLEMAGDSELIVVGSSVGASCALEMARQCPARIAALVLVGGKAAHHPNPALRDLYVNALRTGGIQSLWPEVGSRYFADPSTSAEGLKMALEQVPEDLVRGTEVFHSRPDATDVVADWSKPLAVVVGEHDGFVSVEKARQLATAAPRGQFHLMAGCGHFPNLDSPEAFNDLLRQFTRDVIAN